MSRRLFWATTVAVVCNVGVTASAAQDGPDGTGCATGSTAAVTPIPDEVTGFLLPDSLKESTTTRLSCPMTLDVPVKVCPGIASATPMRRFIDESHPTSAELPLVPLPPPFWTGAAGLLGLGLVSLCKKVRKSLR